MKLSSANPPLIPAARFLAVYLFFGAGCLAASGGSPVAETRLAFSWEYDDNVFEESSGRVNGGAGLVSLFTKIRFDSPGSLTLLNYSLGFKDHHRITDGETLRAGNILVNKFALDSEKRLGRSLSAGLGAELKLRNIYRKNEVNLLSEEGYVRGSGMLFARQRLGRQGTLTAAYRYSFFDFETFRTFNYRAHSPSIKFSRPLAPSLSGAVTYIFTSRSYHRFIAAPGPEGHLVQLPQRQRDNHYQLDFSVAYSRRFLVNFIYSIQRNSSNNYGFSYWNNRFSLLVARKFPHQFFLNAYLFFELKRYSDKVNEPIMVDIITEENDNNGAIVKLSRPLGPALEASLTFSLYRNESSIRDLNFRKNLLNLGLTCRF
ncbi:MAG TPA: hypothetical protein VM123_16530 [archaeon]|nr:hypothetical protein [archaeon]